MIREDLASAAAVVLFALAVIALALTMRQRAVGAGWIALSH